MSDTATRQVLKVLRPDKHKSPIFVVLVQGIGTLEAKDWNLDWLPQHWPVIAFDHHLDNEPDALNWSRIEQTGGTLSELLQGWCSKHKEASLLIIAHSLGSLILLQALYSAHSRHKLQRIKLKGIVFFSAVQVAPAGGLDQEGLLDRHKTDYEIKIIASISQAFASNPLDERGTEQLHPWLSKLSREVLVIMQNTPVLTVAETIETSSGDDYPPFLVNVNAAGLGLTLETIVEADTHHNAVCNVDTDSQLYDKMHEWLDTLVPGAYDPVPSLHLPAHSRLGQSPSRLGVTNSPVYASDDARSQLSALNTEHSGTLFEGVQEPKIPCRHIPFLHNADFRWRESELDELVTYLCPTTDNVDGAPFGLKSVAVTGAGGLGKSQLAMKFVHLHKELFDVILWISADTPQTIDDSLLEGAMKLGLIVEGSLATKVEESPKQRLLNWLAWPIKSNREKDAECPDLANWLVVFDNADDHDMLTDLWPQAERGAVLITSRNPVSGLEAPSARHRIALKPFNGEESRALLLNEVAGSDTSAADEAINEILKILDGHPLGIVQMRYIVALRQETFAAFLGSYHREKILPLLLRSKEFRTADRGHRNDLGSVWRFERLPQRSKQVIDVIAFLDPDGVQDSILLELGKISADCSYLFKDDTYYDNTRTHLLQTSLIKRVWRNRQSELAIHRLVQDSARANMTDDEYCNNLLLSFQLVNAAWPERGQAVFRNEKTDWTTCGLLYKHVMKLAQYISNDRFVPPAVATEPVLQAVNLLLEAAWFGVTRSNLEEATDLLQVARLLLDHVLKYQGVYDPAIKEKLLDVLLQYEHDAGVLALHVNESKQSLHHLYRYWQSLDQSPDKEKLRRDVKWGIAHTELGNAYLQNGQPEFAEHYYEVSVKIFNAIGGTSTHDINTPLIHLGYALMLMNRTDEARKKLDAVQKQRARAYDSDDNVPLAEGMLYFGLGNVLLQLGKTGESMRYHELCVKKFKAGLGSSHHRTADGLVKLADHHFRDGNMHKTRELLEEAAKIYADRDVFKPERARVAYKLWRLANRQGSDDMSMHAERALDLYGTLKKKSFHDIAALKDEDFDRLITFWSR